MKRISTLSLAAVAAGGLGCGSGGIRTGPEGVAGEPEAAAVAAADRHVPAAGYPQVPLTEPWSSMGLPTTGGQVVVSDPTTLVVAFDEPSVEDLALSYRAAVVASGWTEAGPSSSLDGVVSLFEQDGRTLGLGLRDQEGVILVLLEDRSRVEADNAKVRNAKPNSEPPPDDLDAFRTRRPSAKKTVGKARKGKTGPRKGGKRKGGKRKGGKGERKP